MVMNIRVKIAITLYIFSGYIIFMPYTSACNESYHLTGMKVAVSRLTENYANWLKRVQPDITLVDFYDQDPESSVREIKYCSGLLLTGGGDIAPMHYGRAEYTDFCRNVDAKRDALELKLAGSAMKLGLPIFAICRGMQMLNVAFGGTLIPDIPAFMSSEVMHQDKEDVFHPVSVILDSHLYRITGVLHEMVSSSHHQAIDRLAAEFMTSATSEDGIPEAIEYLGSHRTFCMGVQWHPERMMISNPLSGKLGRAFLEASRKVMSNE
jgi:putative glutamine amidotransferase